MLKCHGSDDALNRVPVQLMVNDSWPLPPPDPHRIKVRSELNMAQLMQKVRARCITGVKPCQAIFMFSPDGTLAPQNSLLCELAEKFADKEDRILYLTLMCENTFGSNTCD